MASAVFFQSCGPIFRARGLLQYFVDKTLTLSLPDRDATITRTFP